MEDTMGAAKKVVQLERKTKKDTAPARKTKKVELTEIIKEDKPEVTSFTEYARLAQSLTREKSLSHDEVEATLEHRVAAEPLLFTPSPEAAHKSAPQAAPAAQAPRRDMSKIALFASLAAVILLLGFYFNLNQNIKQLTMQVQDLSVIKTTVSSLDTKVGTMESKVAELETLPSKTRAALMSSILQEMTQKTSYMSTQLQSPEQQEKLMKAKELIQQVQTELNTLN
jgi:outer membrane murein-binding lipoprotein Lpp